MPYPNDDDNDAPQRPRWLGWLIILAMVLIVLGVLNIGVRIWLGAAPGPAAAASAATTAVPADPALARGQALVQASDCMRCHGVERQFVGPAFSAIAARYQARADAPEHLARKIREGGVGEWGRTIMPRHPQVDAAQSLQMAQWVLALQPPATARP